MVIMYLRVKVFKKLLLFPRGTFVYMNKNSRFSVQDTQNSVKYRKSGKKISGYIGVRAYVGACVRASIRTLKKSDVCISKITKPIKLKFGMEVKLKCEFLQYNFHRYG